jgi:group I intron endonuclease
MRSGIYIIKCKANHKFYVGSAVNYRNRWAEHRRRLNAGSHHCIHLQRSWDKYGQNDFEFCLVEFVEKENLIMIEQRWIDAYWDNGVLLNSCRIAGSVLGRKHSQEAKNKISQSHIGVIHSESTIQKMKQSQSNRSAETRIKMSIAQQGKIHSSQERDKIRESMRQNTNHFGKKDSEETKKKKSEAQKRRWSQRREI